MALKEWSIYNQGSSTEVDDISKMREALEGFLSTSALSSLSLRETTEILQTAIIQYYGIDDATDSSSSLCGCDNVDRLVRVFLISRQK